MFAATLLVLLIIVVELYRPIIIGDAIDENVNEDADKNIENHTDKQ